MTAFTAQSPQPAHPTQMGADASSDRRLSNAEHRVVRLLRAVTLLGLGTGLVIVWRRDGVPLERLQVMLWVAAAMTIATVGRPGGGVVRILRDWVPLAAILAVYDLSRGIADGLGMPVQMASLVKVEQFLFGGNIPTVWAQERLGPYTGPTRWWEVPVALTYFSHFVVTFLVLGMLWVKNRQRFREYRNRFLALTGAGLATYMLLPAAPPWMASNADLIGPVKRVGLRGFEPFGLFTADSLVTYGSRFGNPVAAMPSLHGGWSMLAALLAAKYLPRWTWPLLFSYPLIMGVSLVISGEHFAIDVFAGYLYAATVVVAFDWYNARRARREASTIDLRQPDLRQPGLASAEAVPAAF